MEYWEVFFKTNCTVYEQQYKNGSLACVLDQKIFLSESVPVNIFGFRSGLEIIGKYLNYLLGYK
jgi:hypothetical protein